MFDLWISKEVGNKRSIDPDVIFLLGEKEKGCEDINKGKELGDTKAETYIDKYCKETKQPWNTWHDTKKELLLIT